MPLPKHFSGKEIELPKEKPSEREVRPAGRGGAAAAFLRDPYFVVTLIVALAAGAIYFLGDSSIIKAVFNRWVLLALGAGFLLKFLESQKPKDSLFFGVAIAATVGIIIFFLPTILSAAAPYVPIAKEYSKSAEIFLNPEKIISQTLPLEILGQQQAESAPQKRISVDFINPTKRALMQEGGVTANLNVLDKEEPITLVPKCFLDGKPITASPSSIPVEKRDSEQTFQVTCSSPVTGENLALKIESSFRSNSTLVVSVGKAASKARVLSIPAYDSPYTLSIDLAEPQPLAMREVPYPLNVNFFRKEDGTNLLTLNSLRLMDQSSYYTVSCNSPFEGKLLQSLGRGSLDEIVANKQLDRFTFICGLKVTDMPDENAVMSYISADADYVIEKEFKTRLSD